MNSRDAYARFVLGILRGTEIVDLAQTWIQTGLDSAALEEICRENDAGRSCLGPLFETAMHELEVPVPTRREAAFYLVESSLRRIADGASTALADAEFLYFDVHRAVLDELPDKQYVGDSLGIEYVFCWLREIWDCRDGSMMLYYTDLPREQAEVKLFERLRESAEDWLRSQGYVGSLTDDRGAARC